MTPNNTRPHEPMRIQPALAVKIYISLSVQSNTRADPAKGQTPVDPNIKFCKQGSSGICRTRHDHTAAIFQGHVVHMVMRKRCVNFDQEVGAHNAQLHSGRYHWCGMSKCLRSKKADI